MAEENNAQAEKATQQEEKSQDANAGGEQGGGFNPITSEGELSAYKASLRKSIADEFERKQREKDDAETRNRERLEQEKRGEFDKVRQSLETERDEAKAALADRDAKVASYEKLATKRVEAVKAGIPAEALEDFPDDADALEQLTWLEGRAALLAKLIPAGTATGGGRVMATPQPQGTMPNDRIEAEMERLKRTGAYGI